MTSVLLTQSFAATFEKLAQVRVIQMAADERGAVAGLEGTRRAGFLVYGKKVTTVTLPEAIGHVQTGYLLRTLKRTYVVANRQVYSRADGGAWVRVSLKLPSESSGFLFAFSLSSGIVVYDSFRDGEKQLSTTIVLGDNGDQQAFTREGVPRRMGADQVVFSKGRTAFIVGVTNSGVRKTLKTPGPIYLVSATGGLVCATGYRQAAVVSPKGAALADLGKIRGDESKMMFEPNGKTLWYTDSNFGLAFWNGQKLHRGWASGAVNCLLSAGNRVVAFVRSSASDHLEVGLCTLKMGRPAFEKLAECPGPTNSFRIASSGGGIYVGTDTGVYLLRSRAFSADESRSHALSSHHREVKAGSAFEEYQTRLPRPLEEAEAAPCQ